MHESVKMKIINNILSVILRLNRPSSLLLLFVKEMLQLLNHLCKSTLNPFQELHVSFGLRSPQLNTAVQMWPHQCWVEGRDHLLWPAGSALCNASQDAIGLLGHKDMTGSWKACCVPGHPGPSQRDTLAMPTDTLLIKRLKSVPWILRCFKFKVFPWDYLVKNLNQKSVRMEMCSIINKKK